MFLNLLIPIFYVRQALESNNCGIKLSVLPEVKKIGFAANLGSLEDCLELPIHSLNDLEK